MRRLLLAAVPRDTLEHEGSVPLERELALFEKHKNTAAWFIRAKPPIGTDLREIENDRHRVAGLPPYTTEQVQCRNRTDVRIHLETNDGDAHCMRVRSSVDRSSRCCERNNNSSRRVRSQKKKTHQRSTVRTRNRDRSLDAA